MNYRLGIFLLLFVVIIFSGCTQKDDRLIRITTSVITEFPNNEAQSGGFIIITDSDQLDSTDIVSRGVVWGTAENPTFKTKTGATDDGHGDGVFVSHITELTGDQNYFVRAYAIVGNDTVYGNQLIYALGSKAGDRTPAIITKEITGVTNNSAIAGGVLGEGFKADEIVYGLILSRMENPSLDSNEVVFNFYEIVSDFTKEISDLEKNTSYYVRAYVKHGDEVYYGEEKKFTTYGDQITDFDGNVYYTIKIGNQEWFKDNLRTTHYNNGAPMANITDVSMWPGLDIGAYTFFGNSIKNKNEYGALYNWNAVNTGKLCPEGWTVPTRDQWDDLIEYLGGNAIAGGKMKSTQIISDDLAGWITPNIGATNESRFSALPGGILFSSGMLGIGRNGYYWTATERNRNKAWHVYIFNSSANILVIPNYKNNGYSVRCIRNIDSDQVSQKY